MCGSANVVRYQSAILLRRRKVSSRKFRRTFCSSATYCATPEPHNESQQAAGIFLHLLTATTPSPVLELHPTINGHGTSERCAQPSAVHTHKRTSSHLLEHASRTACCHFPTLRCPSFTSQASAILVPLPHLSIYSGTPGPTHYTR